MGNLRNLLSRWGVTRPLNWLLTPVHRRRAMGFPTFNAGLHARMVQYGDYYRYATLGLAVQRVLTENIPGALAEVGVYRGYMSRFIHRIAPERTYYLFDPFEGFRAGDFEAGEREDRRFRDTSVAHLLQALGDRRNVVLRPGYVPDTFAGLEPERFAFVLLDVDKHKPTAAALEFFYPRLSPGAFLAVHDYNSPESGWACKRALDDFLVDKPERIVELADISGTALLRKA